MEAAKQETAALTVKEDRVPNINLAVSKVGEPNT